MTNNITELVGKLLAQAEGAGTEAESEIFMAKAQKLATQYSVDLALARHATEVKHRTVPVTRRVTLGERGTRGLNTLVELITNIGTAQGVQSTIAHNSTFVNFFGFAEDIDITEALFASLAVQMVKASEEFKATGEWKQDTTYRPGRYRYVDYETGKPCSRHNYRAEQEWVDGGYKPINWLSARLDFQQAFAVKVGHRLIIARNEAQVAVREEEERKASAPHLDADGELTEEFVSWFADEHGLDLTGDDETAIELADSLRQDVLTDPWFVELVAPFIARNEAPVSTGTELVLADKARTVRDYYAQETRHIRGSYRGGRSGGGAAISYNAGSAAGSRASLSRSTSIGGSRAALA